MEEFTAVQRPPDEAWDALTNARRIALLGASDRSRFTANLLATNEAMGFNGEIHLVNPRQQIVHGRPAHASISEIPGPAVDCAILSVPNRVVLDALREVIAAGVRAVVVHSAGFAELGGDGLRAQAEITEICTEAGVGLLGPNCTGLVSYPNRVCLSGASVPAGAPSGPVGFVSQSGAVNILAQHTGRHLRFSHAVSTGNEAVIAAEDVIGWLVDDPHTAVIGAFIEQLRAPSRFVSAAIRGRIAGKPIVILKSGRSVAGSQAAHSHTGALVGSDAAFRAVCRRHGVIAVDDFDELFETLVLLSTVRSFPAGPRTVIAGISGGQASALADTAEAVGLPLSPPRPRDDQPMLGQNPIDLAAGLGAGQGYGEALIEVLDALEEDDGVDQICLAQDLTPGYSQSLVGYIDPFLESVEARAAAGHKPVVLMSTVGGGVHPQIQKRAAERSLPVLQGARAALAAMRSMGEYGRGKSLPTPRPTEPDDDRRALLEQLMRASSNHALTTGLLDAYHIPRPPERLARSATEAIEAADHLGYPVVVKAISARLAHRSDIGAVRVGLTTADAVEQAHNEVERAALAKVDPIDLDGVAVARQADGPELYVALRFDRDFGAVLAIALGGLYVELHPEAVEVDVPPPTRSEALRLIRRLRVAPVISGSRGHRRDHTDELAHIVTGLARLGADGAGLLDAVEINPLILSEDLGAVAADIKIEAVGSSAEARVGGPEPPT